MSATTIDLQEIPAALPVSESEDEREELLKRAASENASAADDGNPAMESDEEDDLIEANSLAKPSKKKLFLAFVCFVFCFVLLLAILCWFFGIGAFAATKPEKVDRTSKTNQSSTASAPATEEEKLKMALNLVAEKNPAGSESNLASANSTDNAGGNSSVTVAPTKLADLNEPVVVPDSLSQPNAVKISPLATNGDSNRAQNSLIAEKNQSALNGEKSNRLIDAPKRSENEIAARASSLFFGVRKQEKSVSDLLSQRSNQAVLGRENADTNANLTNAAPIPFGTLLPVRFLGAVFTLRASGGLVRMELTRAVSGKNYSYPSGTVLVGTLRGSEYKRAFVSVVGLIDPKSGGLIKFEGEVMGSDGASGVVGRRRKVKGAWSRVLAGLRDVGASAVNVIGSRSSGGTVVISDSTARASGILSQELGGLTRGGQNPGEFVEISAGTNAYVLVTDLPDEVSETSNLAQNKQSATGLTDDELANLFSEGSPEKIRAALPRMTPEFRRLAEAALAALGGE